MSGGFNNPLVGAGGGLVYPSIHSPNFITGVSGWSINKDGSAEFDNLTFRGTFTGDNVIINRTGFFTYSVAGGAAGKLVQSSGIDINGRLDPFNNSCLSGETFYFDTGIVGPTRFLAMQLSGGGIAALTQWWVAATEAGPWTQLLIFIQGQTNGGLLISAPSFSLQGSSAAQSVISSGGNLLESVPSNDVIQVEVPGTGAWVLSRAADFQRLGGGNAIAEIHQGLEVEPSASGFGTLFLKDSVAAPSQAVGFNEPYSLQGHLLYKSGQTGDTTNYNTGHKTLITASQLFNSVSVVPLTGITFPVAIGTYKISVALGYSSTVAAGTPIFSFTGPAVSQSWLSAWFGGAAGGPVVNPVRNQPYTGNMTGPTLANGDFTLLIECTATFTAAGNLVLNGACSVAVDTFTVKPGGWVTVEPVI